MAAKTILEGDAVDRAFARFLALDEGEFEMAADQAADRLMGLEEAAGRGGPGAKAAEAELDRAYVENGAAEWRSLLMRAQNAESADYPALALQGALYGFDGALDGIVEKASEAPLEALHGIIDSFKPAAEGFSCVSLATFRGASPELVRATQAAGSAVACAETALRAHRAERLSRADAGTESKSARNRARRAEEAASLAKEAEGEYRRACACLSTSPWVRARLAGDPARILAGRGAVPPKGYKPARALEEAASRLERARGLSAGAAPGAPLPRASDPAPEAAQAAAGAPAEEGAGWVRIKFPPESARRYRTGPGAGGVRYEKAMVAVPAGAAVSGMPLDGYSVDVFLQGFHIEALKAGKPVTLRFPADRPVALIGPGGERAEANPWALSCAVKAAREAACGSGRDGRGGPAVAARAAAELARAASFPARAQAARR